MDVERKRTNTVAPYPPCREEEGELLREATEKGVVNVARYYHHETVHVGGSEDDVNGNVRKGLDIMKVSNAFRIASVSKTGQDAPTKYVWNIDRKFAEEQK
jgi:hypothetical protein